MHFTPLVGRPKPKRCNRPEKRRKDLLPQRGPDEKQSSASAGATPTKAEGKKSQSMEGMEMDISGVNLPEPCFGIGIEELVRRWIDRESAEQAAGMLRASKQTKMMRRELQEAANLVIDPSRYARPEIWDGCEI